MESGKTIFVIDDDTALRTAYAAALSAKGHSVESASDGLEGLDLLKQTKPALIVLDMSMPNMDGIGFLKEMRKDAANAKVKVVVITNFDSLPEADQLGVVKYVSKLEQGPDAIAEVVDGLLQDPTPA